MRPVGAMLALSCGLVLAALLSGATAAPLARYGDEPVGYPMTAYTPTPGHPPPTPTRWPTPVGTPDAYHLVYDPTTMAYYDTRNGQWWVKDPYGRHWTYR